jgi:hypothetical protein
MRPAPPGENHGHMGGALEERREEMNIILKCDKTFLESRNPILVTLQLSPCGRPNVF